MIMPVEMQLHHTGTCPVSEGYTFTKGTVLFEGTDIFCQVSPELYLIGDILQYGKIRISTTHKLKFPWMKDAIEYLVALVSHKMVPYRRATLISTGRIYPCLKEGIISYIPVRFEGIPANPELGIQSEGHSPALITEVFGIKHACPLSFYYLLLYLLYGNNRFLHISYIRLVTAIVLITNLKSRLTSVTGILKVIYLLTLKFIGTPYNIHFVIFFNCRRGCIAISLNDLFVCIKIYFSTEYGFGSQIKSC